MTTIPETVTRVLRAFDDGVQWDDVPEVLRALADCAERSELVKALLALCINNASGTSLTPWAALSVLVPAALNELRS